MRPTRATVDLAAIRHNLALAAARAPGAKNAAVVKANAYGHGAVAVAAALEPMADALAVAFLDEAVALREAGIRCPILVLEGCLRADEMAEAAARGLWLMLHERRQVEWLLAAPVAQPLTAWLKVDTGMHRLGVAPAAVPGLVESLLASGKLAQPLVLCTHLARADEPASAVTREQNRNFRALAAAFGLPISIANSAGILYWPETHADWNRPGYLLYGSCPSGLGEAGAAGLRPAMTLSSELIAVREVQAGATVGYGGRWQAERPSRIGTVAIGYADGYPRYAPSGTPVLVRGQRARLVGVVSMDMITVDLSDVAGAAVGDRVELWGCELSVNEVAAHAGTIGYQLLAGLTGRVPIDYCE